MLEHPHTAPRARAFTCGPAPPLEGSSRGDDRGSGHESCVALESLLGERNGEATQEGRPALRPPGVFLVPIAPLANVLSNTKSCDLGALLPYILADAGAPHVLGRTVYNWLLKEPSRGSPWGRMRVASELHVNNSCILLMVRHRSLVRICRILRWESRPLLAVLPSRCSPRLCLLCFSSALSAVSDACVLPSTMLVGARGNRFAFSFLTLGPAPQDLSLGLVAQCQSFVCHIQQGTQSISHVRLLLN